MQPFSNEVWPWILDEIERTVSDAAATGRGRLLLIRGEPGLGRIRLLADAVARLSQRSPRPAMMAGGFDVAGARGDFTALPLPPATIDADSALDALGHAFSTAGAAVAVTDPTGVVKAAGAIAALFGESSSGAAFLSREAPKQVRFQDPDALLTALI